VNCFNIVDSGYVELTENQIKNFQQSHMLSHDLHIACLDSHSLSHLKSFSLGTRNVHFIDKLIADHSARHAEYGDESFRKITSIRPSMIFDIVMELNGALHTEADIVWFKDPREIVERHDGYDWLIQHDNPHIDNTWINMGCAYYTSASGSQKLFREWVNFHKTSGMMDQESLMCMLDSYVPNQLREFGEHAGYKQACDAMGVKIVTWDRSEVQNGYNAFREDYYKKYSPHAIHANHHVGVRAKIELLKLCGGWI
jgi:hypothetical protein